MRTFVCIHVLLIEINVMYWNGYVDRTGDSCKNENLKTMTHSHKSLIKRKSEQQRRNQTHNADRQHGFTHALRRRFRRPQLHA